VVCVSAAPRDAYAGALIDRQRLDQLNGGAVLIENNDIMISAPNIKVSTTENHLIVPINPNVNTQSMRLDLQLQPAGHVEGLLVGADGKPVDNVECIGLSGLPKVDVIKGGSFAVLTMNGQSDRDLCFRQAERNLGRIYHLPANAQGLLRIELYGYGTITGRLVDAAGKPITDTFVPISGPAGMSPITFPYGFTNKEGAFRLGLLPEVKYTWQGYQLANDPGELELEPNETKDLGNLIMAAPPKPPIN
jgi:hypothetical protein